MGGSRTQLTGVEAADRRRSGLTSPLDPAIARQLRQGYNALADALNATRRAIAEHNARGGCRVALPLVPIEGLRALKDLIQGHVRSGRIQRHAGS
jgi:hypothetical protein